MDEFHHHAEWVVCIDPNMDERLIAMKETETGGPRQIIGFGSGVGYGESNYTISTELYQWSDVKNRLSASIAELFVGWKPSEYPVDAAVILAESRRLSGLSLVRATGRGEYLRDFLAYTMTRKLLLANGSPLCDQLTVSVVEMGQPFVRRICLEDNGSSEIRTDKHVSHRPDSIELPNHEENAQEEYPEQKEDQQIPVEVPATDIIPFAFLFHFFIIALFQIQSSDKNEPAHRR